MRVLACVLLLALAIPAFAQDPLQEGTEAYRQGDLARAARLFSEAAAQEPNAARRADIRVRLAWTYHGMRSRSKAEEALAAALTDNPGLELVPDYYTEDFLQLFQRVKQRQAEPRRTGGAPGRTQEQGAASLRQRLAIAIDNTELEAILTDLAVLEAATPQAGQGELLELRSEVLSRLGRVAEATETRGRVAALRAVTQALPGTPVVPLDALLEARQLLAAARAREAEWLLRGVLAVLPSSVAALEVLGEALMETGSLDEAHSALRTAMLGNEKPELWLLLGEVEMRRNRIPNARDAFRRAADMDPGSDRAWAALGLLAARMDDQSSARDALDKALQINGTLFAARVVRAQIAIAEGKPADAINHLQRALQGRPDDPWASGWLGAALLASGSPDAAAERLAAAAGAMPEVFSLPLAEALRRQRRIDESLAAADRAPGGREASLLRARVLLDAGRAEEASALLRQLSDQRPSDGRARYLLGVALHAARSWEQAVTELEQAALAPNAPAGAAAAAEHARASLLAQRQLDAALTPPAAAASR